MKACTDCRGTGRRIVLRQIGPGMVTHMQAECETCSGTGLFCLWFISVFLCLCSVLIGWVLILFCVQANLHLTKGNAKNAKAQRPCRRRKHWRFLWPGEQSTNTKSLSRAMLTKRCVFVLFSFVYTHPNKQRTNERTNKQTAGHHTG